MNPFLAALPIVVACVMLALRLSPVASSAVALVVAAGVGAGTGGLTTQTLGALPSYAAIIIQVLLILLTGIVLARFMQISGAMREIGYWVSTVTPGIGAGTAFVVLGLVPFVESVTGYGIGVTVGVPILVTLGHKPLRAALFGLFGLCAVPWGALAPGTAVAANLSGVPLTQLGISSAWLNGLVLLTVAITITLGTGVRVTALPAFGSAAVLWAGILGANMLVGTPLAGVIGSVVVIAVSLGVYKLTGVKIPVLPVRALIPYTVLSLGLLACSVFAMVVPAASWAALPPLWLFIACVVAYRVLPGREGTAAEVPAAIRSWLPIAGSTLMFMLVGWVMSQAGMSNEIGRLLAPAGVWPAPLLGAMGAILTGANTASNAMFSPTVAAMVPAGSGGLMSLSNVVASANVTGSFTSAAAPPRVLMAVTLAEGEHEYTRALGLSLAIGLGPAIVGAILFALLT